MRTSKIFALGVDDAQHGLRIVCIAHCVERDDKVLVCHLHEKLEAWAFDQIIGRAANMDESAHRGSPRLQLVRVDQGLIQVEHKVELPRVQLVLCVRRQQNPNRSIDGAGG